MVQNGMKAAVAGTLITVLAVACPPAAAKDTEKVQHLGVVNGQVKDNQVVEVSRSLNDPVLYKTDSPEVLPQVLRIRDATARAGNNGSVWLTTTGQPLVNQRSAGITANVRLWVDGKVVPVNWVQQGVDVLIHSPEALQQVMLQADGPVIMQVPANWRGSLQVPLEITGE
ncbi:fimbrial protein [Salmonella enterica]|nr:fimbrial protein [Salmonella enterica]